MSEPANTSVGADRRLHTVALYLPQFYPIPANDRWWGEGYTEWTAVVSGRPLYRGHRQPRLPGELGYYDLRDDDVRHRQAALALEHGVSAFCYWHYWHGDGDTSLELPIERHLADESLAMPFCLGWANHDWSLSWSGRPHIVTQRQLYPGVADIDSHFRFCQQYFEDPRYVRVNGRSLIYIFRPERHPHLSIFVERWNDHARNVGLPPFMFVGAASSPAVHLPLDGVTGTLPVPQHLVPRVRRVLARRLHEPLRLDYRTAAVHWRDETTALSVPTVWTGWDNTPRHKTEGRVLFNDTPANFRDHVTDMARAAMLSRTGDAADVRSLVERMGRGQLPRTRPAQRPSHARRLPRRPSRGERLGSNRSLGSEGSEESVGFVGFVGFVGSSAAARLGARGRRGAISLPSCRYVCGCPCLSCVAVHFNRCFWRLWYAQRGPAFEGFVGPHPRAHSIKWSISQAVAGMSHPGCPQWIPARTTASRAPPWNRRCRRPRSSTRPLESTMIRLTFPVTAAATTRYGSMAMPSTVWHRRRGERRGVERLRLLAEHRVAEVTERVFVDDDLHLELGHRHLPRADGGANHRVECVEAPLGMGAWHQGRTGCVAMGILGDLPVMPELTLEEPAEHGHDLCACEAVAVGGERERRPGEGSTSAPIRTSVVMRSAGAVWIGMASPFVHQSLEIGVPELLRVLHQQCGGVRQVRAAATVVVQSGQHAGLFDANAS